MEKSMNIKKYYFRLRLWWSFYKLEKAIKKRNLEHDLRVFIEKKEHVNIFNYP